MLYLLYIIALYIKVTGLFLKYVNMIFVGKILLHLKIFEHIHPQHCIRHYFMLLWQLVIFWSVYILLDILRSSCWLFCTCFATKLQKKTAAVARFAEFTILKYTENPNKNIFLTTYSFVLREGGLYENYSSF